MSKEGVPRFIWRLAMRTALDEAGRQAHTP